MDTILVGIIAGGVYSLIGVAITLMYRTTGILSFAHAAFAMVAGYTYADLAGDRHWSPVVAALAAVVVSVAFGLAVEVVLRPVSRSSGTMKLVATLGVLALSGGLVEEVFGFEASNAPPLLLTGVRRLGSVGIVDQQLLIFVLAAVAAIGIGVFLRYTRFGTAIRATAQNAEAARLMGIRQRRVAQFNWALGALLAGLGGVLVAPLFTISVATFPVLLFKSLTATLFGGLLSLPLTFLGGLVVGAVEALATAHSSSPGARELAVLGVVVVVLLVRRNWAVGLSDESALVEVPPSPAAARRRERVRSATAGLRQTLRPLLPPALAVAAVVGVVVPARSDYWGYVGIVALYYVLESLSLVVLVGWAGQVSLMHAGYVGIGAFGAAYLSTTQGLPLELAVVVASGAGMLLGALAGLPALRLSGIQFAIASLAFASACSEWLFRRPSVPHTFGTSATFLGVHPSSSSHFFLVLLGITAAVYLLVWNLRRSSFGALLLAARDAPQTVAHFGVGPRGVRMSAFLLASFLASLGGGLLGMASSYVSATQFSVQLSIALLLYAVVGGVDSLAGPLLAGVLFGVLPQVLQQRSGTSATAIPDIISGLTVLYLVSTNPRGLAALFHRKPAGDVSAEPGARRLRRAVGSRPIALGRFDVVVAREGVR